MRAWTIKHKGATIWQNFPTSVELTISETTVYACYLFFRKKDAQAYLATYPYPEYFEVIGLTIDKSETDNRRK